MLWTENAELCRQVLTVRPQSPPPLGPTQELTTEFSYVTAPAVSVPERHRPTPAFAGFHFSRTPENTTTA